MTHRTLGKIVWAVAAASGVILMGMAALAQGVSCGSYEGARAYLAKTYDEKPVAVAALDEQGGGTVIVFAAPGGKTWSLVIRRPDGLACLVANGVSWRLIADPS